MTRSSFRPMASVGLVAAVLVYVGCAKTPVPVAPPVATAPKTTAAEVQATPQPPPKVETAAKADKTPKILSDWSNRAPMAVLMISGEQDGYPDPCGCTSGQLGGLGRRDHLCEMLEAKGWPVVKIDLGNLIHNPGNARGGRAQEKIKFNVIQKALALMKYDAVALGPEDLKLGIVDTLVSLLNAKEPAFLAANVKASDKGLGEGITSTRIVKAGGLVFGITAVLDPATYKAIQDDDAGMLTVQPPDEVLGGVFDELRKQAPVKILMVQGPPEEAKRLAEKFPGFDIVVGTSRSEDPDANATTVNGGRTLLINNIGKKGKYVGLVAFRPVADQRMEFRQQALDGEHFHQSDRMKVLIDKEYQDMLKVEGVVENFPRSGNSQAPGATYLGAKACQECHPRTFARWETTKHARAYEPLLNPKRNREFDAECISCHTTGFGYTSGWVSAEKTPLLKGNQCENCHGPASLHAADPDNPAARRSMVLSAESAKSTAFCTKCHDPDNDPHFNFDTYYPQIYHKGFDTYDDPKVHRPAKVADGAR